MIDSNAEVLVLSFLYVNVHILVWIFLIIILFIYSTICPNSSLHWFSITPNNANWIELCLLYCSRSNWSDTITIAATITVVRAQCIYDWIKINNKQITLRQQIPSHLNRRQPSVDDGVSTDSICIWCKPSEDCAKFRISESDVVPRLVW